jgi:acyl-coenzyme A thioesterase PaaI-like protein
MVTAEQLNTFLENDFPQCRTRVDKLDTHYALVRHKVEEMDLRPGGTVSGPVMFGVADAALYMAILGEIGLVPLAVTTNININFLNKPDASNDLLGECRLIKVGSKLIIGDVFIYSEGHDKPVAHATGTYSIPPKKV